MTNHVPAHNLLFATVAASIAALISKRAALLAFAAVHLHLLCDLATFVLAWSRGYSPVGLFSPRADAAFVGALRRRVRSRSR